MSPEQKVPCQEIEEQLSAYLDGELSPEEKAAVDAHLAGCPECTSTLEDLREMVQSVGSLPRLAAPDGFADRMMDRVKPRKITPIGLRIGALAAAASVLLVASLYVGGVIGQKERRGRDTAILHEKAPGALLAGEPRPAAPAEEGFAVGRAAPAAPGLEVQMKKGADIPEEAQVAVLAFTPDQKDLVDRYIKTHGDRRREKEEKDLDKEGLREDEMPPPPAPLDQPGYYQWKSLGENLSRKLTKEEVDGFNRAQNDRNVQNLSLPQEETDQILDALSKAGVKVLILDEEEEAVQDGAAERKTAETRDLMGKVNKRMEPAREALERMKGEEPDARELMVYYILRIKIAQ